MKKIKKSGHGPRYSLGPTKAEYVSSLTGAVFETRKMLQIHNAAFRKRVKKDFEELVRTKSLGMAPWERLPGESPLAYKRFQTYLHLPQRSQAKVAAIHKVKPHEVSRWSAGWHWSMRADLWDRHIEQKELEEFEKSKRKSARNQAHLGQKLQKLALVGAASLLEDDDRIMAMTGNEIAKLADIGVKVERLANSDPTSISEDRQTVLVWEGPKPSWAKNDGKVIEGS